MTANLFSNKTLMPQYVDKLKLQFVNNFSTIFVKIGRHC